MFRCILLVQVCFIILELCEGQVNIQQAKADLAAGGRRVCPYCSYCGFKGYCPCSYAECDLCVYKYHCDSTCTGLCQTPDDPCQSTTCPVNSTCHESNGTAVCVCDVGKVCDIDPKCVEKSNAGDCDFYKCMDDRKNCGDSGYPRSYGYKYCTRFAEHNNEFTTAGQNMISCVRRCLTNELLDQYKANDPAGPATCANIQSVAFNSHVKCYYDCDFCHVWDQNKLALFNVYDITDFFKREAIKQVYEVGKKCAKTTTDDIDNWLNTNFKNAINYLFPTPDSFYPDFVG